MATNNMHNLTTLIKRLEAATTRLEDIASSTIELPQAVPALAQTTASPPPVGSPAPLPPVTSKAAPQEELSESVANFDIFISTSVEPYVKASNLLGGLIAEQAFKVLEGFKHQRRFILITTKAKKPDPTGPEMMALFKPLVEEIEAVMGIARVHREHKDKDHLEAVAQAMMVFDWVQIGSEPHKHVEGIYHATIFNTNKVRKEHKEQAQTDWVNAWLKVFKDLEVYVKKTFPSGIPWNPKGQPAVEVAEEISVSGAATPTPPPAAGGAPPPPPPPGPPPVLQIKEEKAQPVAASGLGAVFSELNKGSDVTKALRKVDKSEMTHKNPTLRAASTVPDRDSSVRGKSPVPGKKPKPESMRIKKPPKKELDGNKWVIENYEKGSPPIEIEASLSHSILISKCSHTTIIIKGKANAVTVENTQRLSLIVDSLISTVDVVKSSSFALQVMGVIPTVMLDQLDGAEVYLSKESVGTRIFSSKSAGINLNVIGDKDEDYRELALPSQICTYYDKAKGDLVNEIVDHAG